MKSKGVMENYETFEKWFNDPKTKEASNLPCYLNSDLESMIVTDMSDSGIFGSEWENPRTIYNYWKQKLGVNDE